MTVGLGPVGESQIVESHGMHFALFYNSITVHYDVLHNAYYVRNNSGYFFVQ